MLIAGAGGHSIEILSELESLDEEIYFFDDFSKNTNHLIFNKHLILKNEEDVKKIFQLNCKFCLGVGNPKGRLTLHNKLTELGGTSVSIISQHAFIGNHNVIIEGGVNIMRSVVITNNVHIGYGALINTLASIHHDSIIGKYSEISPGARILGHVKIGEYTTIGANAVILPGIQIGSNVSIGAGAVVTKNIPDNTKYAGVPAKLLN